VASVEGCQAGWTPACRARCHGATLGSTCTYEDRDAGAASLRVPIPQVAYAGSTLGTAGVQVHADGALAATSRPARRPAPSLVAPGMPARSVSMCQARQPFRRPCNWAPRLRW